MYYTFIWRLTKLQMSYLRSEGSVSKPIPTADAARIELFVYPRETIGFYNINILYTTNL